jgi:hypothetical protein
MDLCAASAPNQMQQPVFTGLGIIIMLIPDHRASFWNKERR